MARGPKFPKCICQTMRLTFIICRFFGLLAISWGHEKNKCVYKVSKIWICYSLIIAVAMAVHVSKIMPNILTPFESDRSQLLSYIAFINENIISAFILLLIFINLFRAKRIVYVLNEFVAMQEVDLLCPLSLKVYSYSHILFLFVMFIQYFVQFSAIIAFNYIDSFVSDLTYDRLLMPIIHNTAFLLYALFGSICTLSATTLTCYETVIRNVLQYKPCHPIKNFVSNVTVYPFYWKYNVCQDLHNNYKNLQKPTDQIEYLQKIYMRIQNNLSATNQAFNPQLLFHITDELIVMVFHWYAVIVFFTYEKVTPTDNTNNFFHWYYVIIHSWAIYVSMSMSQQIETKVRMDKISAYFLNVSRLPDSIVSLVVYTVGNLFVHIYSIISFN